MFVFLVNAFPPKLLEVASLNCACMHRSHYVEGTGLLFVWSRSLGQGHVWP